MSPAPEPVEEQSVSAQDVEMAQSPPPKTSYKSYKKKYRKIMITFNEKMEESENLFREEQKMQDITRRLQEQNDQILELLNDLNESPELAPELRFSLDTIELPEDAKQSTTELDTSSARAVLAEARQELRSGELTPVDYKRIQDSILRSQPFAPKNSYASILEDLAARPVDDEGGMRFIATRHEEQYLHDLDAFLTGESPVRRPTSYANTSKSGDRSQERDRDTALRNPVSVYNWLRKHQPQVFLQDKENETEKPVGKGTGRGKRNSLQVKPEPEMYDEDGIALDPKPTGRGKRKRDDDGGYRPKGGGTRGAKRNKKEEGSAGTGGRRGKNTETPG